MQAGLLVGAVTLTGSLIAFAKLQELMPGRPITFPGQKPVNALHVPRHRRAWPGGRSRPKCRCWCRSMRSCALSLVLGVLLVIPIGGADMPVVISLLNSYSGIAAGMTGFVINNEVLIISGALVGSARASSSARSCARR